MKLPKARVWSAAAALVAAVCLAGTQAALSQKADPDEVHNLATDPSRHEVLQKLRAKVDAFVRENDVRSNVEDPLDIQRGYYGRMPEESA